MVPQCPNCSEPVEMSYVFCGSCGKKISIKKENKERGSLQLVIVFYLVFLVFSIVTYAIYEESNTLFTEICIESVFILLTLLFSLFDAKRIWALYNFTKVHWKTLLFALAFPVFSGLLVFYGLDWLNMYLFEMTDNIFLQYLHFSNSLFWVIIFVVIIPPIFEELAFRGFLFNQLLQISNWKVTIFATAFLFALVHFSLLSFLWIFPFGVVLGYLRHKYNTLWLGMIIHFIHNLLVVMLDYYYFYHTDSGMFF